MLTYEQKKTLCLLQNAITLDSLFEISPISRINMNAEVHCAPEKRYADATCEFSEFYF